MNDSIEENNIVNSDYTEKNEEKYSSLIYDTIQLLLSTFLRVDNQKFGNYMFYFHCTISYIILGNGIFSRLSTVFNCNITHRERLSRIFVQSRLLANIERNCS